MKSKLLFLGLMLFAQISLAQTNTFPPNGNAGVGTISPENAEGWDKVFEVKGTNHAKLITSTNSVTTGLWSHVLGAYDAPAGGFGGTFSNHPFSLITGAHSRMTIAANGNVGIRTSSPRSVFEVKDYVPTLIISSDKNTEAMVDNEAIGAINFYKHHSLVNAAAIKILQAGDGAYNVPAHLAFFVNGGGDFYGAPVERMRITASGNIGIGVIDTKGYKLAVAGSTVAESVTVRLQGNWPDYVFDKGYQLPSLSETEKSIKEKGHLPGIPSAAEVKNNGLDLGEMNAKLLQKIEELTLHLIEQEKQWKAVVAGQQETNIQLFEQVKKLNNQCTIKSYKANKS